MSANSNTSSSCVNPECGPEWVKLWRNTARLHRSTQRLIFKYLSRHVLVEDIVSETLRYAREHPEQWMHIPEDRLFYYLRRKAKLLVIDQARKYLRHREVLADRPFKFRSAHAAQLCSQPSPSCEIHKGEKQIALHRILGKLENENHRRVLRMVWLDGVPIANAAEQMSRSVEATQMLMSRALRACRSVARRDSFRGFRISGETR